MEAIRFVVAIFLFLFIKYASITNSSSSPMWLTKYIVVSFCVRSDRLAVGPLVRLHSALKILVCRSEHLPDHSTSYFLLMQQAIHDDGITNMGAARAVFNIFYVSLHRFKQKRVSVHALRTIISMFEFISNVCRMHMLSFNCICLYYHALVHACICVFVCAPVF